MVVVGGLALRSVDAGLIWVRDPVRVGDVMVDGAFRVEWRRMSGLEADRAFRAH